MTISAFNLPTSNLLSLNQTKQVSDPIPVDGRPPSTAFSQFLDNELQKLDGLQKDADNASLQLATGQIQDVHNVMIALEKANLGFSLAVEVRNKVLDAYREVMRMQI